MKKIWLCLWFYPLCSSSQNVGIGLTNPEQRLSVAGGAVIDQTNLNTGTVANSLRFGSFSGEAIGSKRTGINNNGLDFYTQGFHRMVIANNGNVGINVPAPNAKLEIRGALGFSSSAKRWEMNYDSTAGYFYIDEFGAGRRLYIKNGGNVGVNTANPQATLDVNGDLNVENRLLLNNSAGTDGQVLVSGGSGSSPEWRNTAYGSNDRFMFATKFWISAASTNYAHPVDYDNIYSNSGAITYNNGIFTVHKAGFYGRKRESNPAGKYHQPLRRWHQSIL